MLTEDGKNAFYELGTVIFGYAIWILVKFGIGFIDDLFGTTVSLIISIALMIIDVIIEIMILMKIKEIRNNVDAPVFDDIYNFYKFAFILSLVELGVYYLITAFVWEDILIWFANPEYDVGEWFMAYLPEIISGIPGIIQYILLYKMWKLFEQFFRARSGDISHVVASKSADASKKLATVAALNALDLILAIFSVWSLLLLLVQGILLLVVFILILVGYFGLGGALKKIKVISQHQQPSYGYTPQEPSFQDMGSEKVFSSPDTTYSDVGSTPSENQFNSAYRFCPKCGEPNKQGGRFCVKCGFDYSQA